jgi:hypothetical protein
MLSGFTAKRDFRSIHLKDTGISPGGRASCGDARAGKKSKFHQPAGVLVRKLDAVEYGSITPAELRQVCEDPFPALVATQLHLGFSMLASEMLVNTPNSDPAIFSRHWLRTRVQVLQNEE